MSLCGTGGSIPDGGRIDDGDVLHLNRASHWAIQGFAIRNGQKGVIIDETTQSVLRGLAVSKLATRPSTSGNSVTTKRFWGIRSGTPGCGNRIRRRSLHGSAESNWCDISSCEPNKSDRNEVAGNDISGTSAECLDLKEGTSGGTVRDNRVDGSSIAESWMDVKGNGWAIDNNFGRNSPADGCQTHEILDDWGTGNVFGNNTAEVNGPGFGYSLTPVRGIVVECSNSASQAGKGVSNEPCKSAWRNRAGRNVPSDVSHGAFP